MRLLETQAPKTKPPHILVLQTESVLLEFTPNSSLPISLETNQLCNCVSLVIYSKPKGLAYLGHIYLDNLNQDHFSNYRGLIRSMIKAYQLNNDNTFVALVGAQDRSLPEKYQNEKGETIFGVASIENLLKTSFTTIHKVVGGPDSYETAVELLPDSLNTLRIDYSNRRRKLVYQRHDIHLSHSNEKSNVLKIQYYLQGKSSIEANSSQLMRFNELISCPDKHNEFNEIVRNSVRNRLIATGLFTSDEKYLFSVTIFNFKNIFGLKENVPCDLNRVVFHCAIYKPHLFEFLKDHLGLGEVIALEMSYDEINCFRFPIVQQLLIKNSVTTEQVKNMTKFSQRVVSKKCYFYPLLNSLGAASLLKLTGQEAGVQELLDQVDTLISLKQLDSEEIVSLSMPEIKQRYQDLDSTKSEGNNGDVNKDVDDEVESPLSSPRAIQCTHLSEPNSSTP